MKALGYRIFLMVIVGSALVFLTFTGAGSGSPALVGSELTKTSRKLKENGYHHPIIGSTKKKRDSGSINLEDYRPVDPAPSSKADTKSGTIEHGTPLMPFIPRPTPPGHPKNCRSP